MDLITAYLTLGISKSSSLKEVKQRYRSLAREFHPDKNNEDSTKKFQDIEYAYTLITNPEIFKNHKPPVSKPKSPVPKPPPPQPKPPPPQPTKSKFKKGQNLDDFLDELKKDGFKKTGKKKNKW
jgi:curved DNA-binding protein CbpA